MPVRGKAWKTGVRARRQAAVAPAGERRVRRQREQHRDVRAHAVVGAYRQLRVGHGDVDVQREGRLAPGQLAQRGVQVLVARAGRDLHVLGADQRMGAGDRGAQAEPAHGRGEPGAQLAQLGGGLADGRVRVGGQFEREPVRLAARVLDERARAATRSTSSERQAGEPSRSSSMISSSRPTVHGSRSGFGRQLAHSGKTASILMHASVPACGRRCVPPRGPDLMANHRPGVEGRTGGRSGLYARYRFTSPHRPYIRLYGTWTSTTDHRLWGRRIQHGAGQPPAR